MSSENKNQAEILMRLLEVAWTNFDRRRSYEWKMSLAIWTAIAAFIALYLKGEYPNISNEAKFTLICAAVLVVLVQIVFLVFIRLANGVDQARAIFYEELLNDATGASKDSRITNIHAAIKKIVWAKGFWSIPCEVLITIILFGVGILNCDYALHGYPLVL